MEIAAELDAAMAEAWPPLATEEVGDWTLRWTEGVTRRANSVRAVGAPADVGAAIAQVEEFYHRHGAAPVVLASDASTPDEVRMALGAKGYEELSPTWIVQRDLPMPSAPDSRRSPWTVRTSEAATDEWFDAYWAVEADRRGSAARRVFRDVLLRPGYPTRFVTVAGADAGADADEIVSVGQVVIVGDHACLQCLATLPAGRRQGAGTVVVEELAAAAVSLGARTAFGAVVATNEASLGLLGRLGYERSHQYRYLVG